MVTKSKKITTKIVKKSPVVHKAKLIIKEETTKPTLTAHLHAAKHVVSVKEKEKAILATGKRKTAVAQIKFFTNGTGEITVNNKPYQKYFPYFDWQKIIERPLQSVNSLKNGRFEIKVQGGGVKSQAEAISLGIARTIIIVNSELRKTLKPLGLLSRDSRVKERKKPGLKRARRAPQWTKR